MPAEKYRCVAQKGATFRAEGQRKAFFYDKGEVIPYLPGIEKNPNFEPVGVQKAVSADFQQEGGAGAKGQAAPVKNAAAANAVGEGAGGAAAGNAPVDPKKLANVTKDQLVVFASKKNVAIDPLGTKAQIFDEIAAAVNKLDANRTSEVVLQELLTFVQTFERAK